MQQAGYQLQDFIVQVQAGTNPLIAFSQQGSQLAGFFAGPWGAAIGLGIAALGGLGTALLGAKGKTEDLHGQLKELFDYLDEGQDSVKNLMETSLSGPMEKARLEALELLKVFQKMEEPKIMEKVGAVVLPLVEKVAEAQDAVAEQRTKKSLFKTGRLSYVFPEDQRNQMLEIEKNLARINESLGKAIKGPIEGMGIRLAEVFMELEKSGVLTDDLRENFKEMMISTGLQAQAQREIAEAQEKQKSNQKAVSEGQKKGEKELKALVDARDAKEKARYGALIRLQRGHYSRLKQEEEKLAKTKDGLTATSLTNATKANAKRIQAETDAEKVRQALEDAFRQRTADAKQTEANNYHNGMIARQTAYYDRERQLAKEAFDNALTVLNVAHTPSMIATLAKYAGRGTVDDSDPIFGEDGKSIYDKDTGPKKRDPLADLQKQINLEQALIGKTEARQRIIQALGVDLSDYNEKTINDLEAQINRTIMLEDAERKRQEALEEAKRQQEEVADTISSSMENAMMSIIDGTKSVTDAFKSMASEIIKELYRIYVVKQITGMVSDAIGLFTGAPVGQVSMSANGNAFRNGSIIPYANGGIVGSPTYFPMAGGKTGLMGEAGPEAIMPLKRGKGGKLGVAVEGGQQPVVINQSFNFAANGDDSVKRIIAQQAPKIAQMTQQQIMDSRRRGGQMKAVFG